jgi:hypothetical protein
VDQFLTTWAHLIGEDLARTMCTELRGRLAAFEFKRNSVNIDLRTETGSFSPESIFESMITFSRKTDVHLLATSAGGTSVASPRDLTQFTKTSLRIPTGYYRNM